MTDVTVTDQAPTPQDQPGPARTEDGTIIDVRETTPKADQKAPTDGTTEDKGNSFLTGKGETPPSADDKKPAEAPKDAQAGAPESYAEFKLPDGYKLDEQLAKDASALFKEMNLSQDAAQRLVDLYAANGLKAAEAPFKEWADLQKTWLGDIADRFGSKAETVRTDIGKAISTLPPSLARNFRAALDLTGAGSHPDVVEALSIMLKPLIEGGSVRQGNLSPAANQKPGEPMRPSAAEAMYPHLIKNRGE